MQETKPGRNRELAKECQDFCERVVCASELENWQCEVPELSKIVSGLSEVGFTFCESPFLGVRKLREVRSLQRAIS